MPAIDFRDLVEGSESLPVLRPRDVRRARGRRAADLVRQLGMFVAIVWLPLAVTRLMSSGHAAAAPGVVLLVGSGVGVVVAVVAGLLTLRRRSRQLQLPRLASFAARNGLVYEPSAQMPSLPGRIFRRRHNPRLAITHSVSEPSGRFRFANLDVDGRSAVGFLAVRLDAQLPHLFLASRPRNSDEESPFSAGLSGEQEVALEGDFPSTFALYVPEGYGTDVRYLLTPDLMALLVDEAGGYSLEIVDNWLFVYSWHPFTDDARVIRRLFDIVDVIGPKIGVRGGRYRDERAPAAGRVGAAGRRLAKGGSSKASDEVRSWVILVVVLVTLGFGFWSAFFA